MDKRQSDVLRIAKGICIFFVVLGHTMIPDIRGESGTIFNVWTVIYLFHMPVFFSVSGILYELNRERYESDVLGFIKNKFRLLVVPYLSVSITAYLILFALTKVPGLSDLISNNVHQVNGFFTIAKEILTYENHIAQHLWFVIVLFLIFLTNILLRKLNQRILCIVMIILPIFFLPILKQIINIPDIPNYYLFEMPFFMFGRLIGQRGNSLKRSLDVNYAPIIFAILSTIYLIFIYDTSVLPDPVRWIYLFITRCSGVLMVYSIAAVIEKLEKPKKMFKYMERKSYQIYLLHQPFIVSGGASILNYLGFPNIIIIVVVTTIGLNVPLAIDKVLGRTRTYQVLLLGGRNH